MEASLMEATLTDQFLLGIFRAFPPKFSIFKESQGRAQAEYEDETRTPIQRYFGLESDLFDGQDMLDLGCGFGGRPIRYLELGAKHVAGVEVEEHKINYARQFAKSKGHTATEFKVGVGEAIPFDDARFDLIVMNDVMEHVVSPRDVLGECYRVLRPGGRLAMVFPPFFDLFGGSHLHGYATSVPGLNLFFSKRALKSATTKLFRLQHVEYEKFLRDIESDKLWNLNGLTVRGYHQIVAETKFQSESLRYIGHRDFRVKGYAGVKKLLHWPLYFLAQVPVMQEILCSRIASVLRKPALAVPDSPNRVRSR